MIQVCLRHVRFVRERRLRAFRRLRPRVLLVLLVLLLMLLSGRKRADLRLLACVLVARAIPPVSPLGSAPREEDFRFRSRGRSVVVVFVVELLRICARPGDDITGKGSVDMAAASSMSLVL